jgi:hypothetical protein
LHSIISFFHLPLWKKPASSFSPVFDPVCGPVLNLSVLSPNCAARNSQPQGFFWPARSVHVQAIASQ